MSDNNGTEEKEVTGKNQDEEARREEACDCGEDCDKETYSEEPSEIASEICCHLKREFEESSFMFEMLGDQPRFTVANIVCDEKIAFRQIIKTDESIQENCSKAQLSYERNLRVYEKLSKEYMETLGQEIRYMDQAEVKSIKTVKEVIKPEKK